MMSATARTRLERSMRNVIDRYGADYIVIHMTPRQLIEGAIHGAKDYRNVPGAGALAKEIRDNKEEAEQMVAGMLGLM